MDWSKAYDNTFYCAGYRIHVWMAEGMKQDSVTIRDSMGVIRARFSMQGRPTVTSCEPNPLGIGMPVAVIYSYSGGVHCCQTYSWWALGEVPRNLLTYRKGNSLDIRDEQIIKDLNGDGILEILSTDDSAGYALEVLILARVVFCLKEGIYVDCSTEFKSEVLKFGARSISGWKPGEPPHWSSGHVFLHFAAAGEPEQGLDWLAKKLSRKELSEFKSDTAQTILRALANRPEKIRHIPARQ